MTASSLSSPAGFASPRWGWHGQWVVAAVIFAVSYAVYIAHPLAFETADTIPTRLAPILLQTQGNLHFDAYMPVFEKKYPHLKGNMYFLIETPSGYISRFPVTPGVLLAPLYAPAVLYKQQSKPTPDEWMKFADAAERVAAAAIAAAGVVVLMFILLQLRAGLSRATLLTLVYAFGTSAFAIFSQQLWQHGLTVLFMLLSVWSALVFTQKSSHAAFALTGVLAGLAVACRPTSIVFACALFAWLAIVRRNSLVPFGLGACAALAPIVAYNRSVYHNIFGGYSLYLSTAEYALSKWSVLAALLLSPGRGLFFYFPVGLLSLWGLYIAWRSKNKQALFYASLCAFCVGQVALIWWVRWNNDWFGGHCWGPRYLSELQFPLVILLVPLLQQYAGVPMAAVVAILGAVSVFLQALGVYVRNDWNVVPIDVNDRPARLWSFHDSPITRALPRKLLPSAPTYAALPEKPLRINAAEPTREMSVDGTTALFAHAPSEIALRSDAQVHSIAGAFGVVPGAYTDGGMTDGVEFIVDFVGRDGKRSTIFRRYLRPVSEPKDRGLQQFSVPVPSGPGEIDLLARSGPEDNRSWDWAYWAGIKLRQ